MTFGKAIFLWTVIFLALFGSATAVQAEDSAPVPVSVQGDKKTVLLRVHNQLYGDPSILERGGRWHISDENGHVYASRRSDPSQRVEVPVEFIQGQAKTAIGYFAENAGLQWEWTHKLNTVRIEQNRSSKKKNPTNNLDLPVALIWDPELSFDESKPFFEGNSFRRVLAPSWMEIGAEGMKEKSFSWEYTDRAHRRDIAVTPLVSNGFDPERTSSFLRNAALVEKTVQQMAAYADFYGWDGYNVDFENMDPRDKDLFTGFVEKLSQLLHKAGRTVSVDVTGIVDNSPFWSGCYDRKALAEKADYLVLMAYDQTPRGSRHAGSVSSYSWVESHIEKMIQEMSPSRLILGIPWYTRIWTEQKGQMSSSVLSYGKTGKFMRRQHIFPQWLSDEKQYFMQWKEGDAVKQVWLEEEHSITAKMSLAVQYHLAGVAFWRYGFEDEEIYRMQLPDSAQEKRGFDGLKGALYNE